MSPSHNTCKQNVQIWKTAPCSLIHSEHAERCPLVNIQSMQLFKMILSNLPIERRGLVFIYLVYWACWPWCTTTPNSHFTTEVYSEISACFEQDGARSGECCGCWRSSKPHQWVVAQTMEEYTFPHLPKYLSLCFHPLIALTVQLNMHHYCLVNSPPWWYPWHTMMACKNMEAITYPTELADFAFSSSGGTKWIGIGRDILP